MPWAAKDATRHTKKATSRRLRNIWAAAANNALTETGDEGRAVRIANAAVRDAAGKPSKKRKARK